MGLGRLCANLHSIQFDLHQPLFYENGCFSEVTQAMFFLTPAMLIILMYYTPLHF